ncbi:MAG: peroxiredoxin [Myxococcales bacterium]|nr:peroxiredoxin [Myxococcales bacterium]
MARALAVGDPVPDFTLDDHLGRAWRFADALAQGPVVIFFYPKDDTPVCIAEACAFRDQHEVFTERGAQVVGISSDGVASHRSFAGRHELPYVLLADPGGEVRAEFGIKKTLGFFDGRVTFVVGRDGRIAHVHRAALNAQSHVDEALSALKKLTS